MSTSVSPLAYAAVLPPRQKVHLRLEIRAQSVRDEGRSSNLVDSSMKVLKDRIEVMRTKEILERNCRPYGWDGASSYIQKPKKQPEFPQTIALICGTSSLPILVGTALLCVISAIAHLNP
ncbi:uncharacterized protein LOC112515890 [Cynara cardunculus var. scolymus]|uniref:Uncharacterized protein n=1 Tax=Cynara cardunculus var. scolymus TaxID=59895 RepID=A0A103XKH0_CYNCS|nr:uncharacterized protein LOC112515890 [Cynara cardunculus var. scolymus]KVH92436.1 hypothetical protein Ccrd_005527 [Cynara cardunculus var. scolymus]